MAYGYTNTCDDDFVAYPCDLCAAKETGRVRGLAFILPTTTFSDYSNAAEWASKINSNEVFVIPNTGGTVGVTPEESTGLGDTEVEITGYNYVIDAMDGNIDAWDEVVYALGNRGMRVAWITETKIWVSTTTASVAAYSPVEDDLKSFVRINYQVKFYQSLPVLPQTRPENTFDTCTTIT